MIADKNRNETSTKLTSVSISITNRGMGKKTEYPLHHYGRDDALTVCLSIPRDEGIRKKYGGRALVGGVK